MITAIFILVINSFHGGINTELSFNTLAQCEAAKEQIKKEAEFKDHISSIKATCIEMQKTKRKLKCKIINEQYHHPRPGHHSGSGALEGFSYPVGIECEE